MLSALVLNGAMMLATQAAEPAPPAASASTTQADVERLFAEGAALYRGGKYRAAVDKFEEAYALFPEPNLLYNMARAYEALGEVDQALTKYRLCVSHPRGSEELKAKAAAKVAVLTAAKASGAASTGPTPGVVSPAPTPDSGAPSATPSAAPAAAASSAPPAAPPSTSSFPVWGVAGGVSAGVGVIAAVAGGVAYAVGASTHAALEEDLARTDVNGVLSVTRAEAEQALADGTNQKTAGVALLVTGGALVAVSVPMFVGQLLGGE
jgi:tetratricopeptide (TPR) repeat protein